jgi:hypothetical protein
MLVAAAGCLVQHRRMIVWLFRLLLLRRMWQIFRGTNNRSTRRQPYQQPYPRR